MEENRITIEPGKRSGQPCIRGLRITVWPPESARTRFSLTTQSWKLPIFLPSSTTLRA